MHTHLAPLARPCNAPAPRAWASTLLLTMLLAACGGGSSEPAPTPTPTPEPTPVATLSATQGIWQSAAGMATSTSAIVLPDGGLWAVQTRSDSASTQVIKATLAVQGSSYSATGKRYTLGTDNTGAPTTLVVTASVVEKSSLVLRTGSGAEAQELALAWQARYDTSASLAGLAGAWGATMGAGTLHWSIDADGHISGTRTTGCTYTGQLSLRAERKAVVDALVLEDCAGARTQLNGVATLNPDTGRLSMVLTTADDSQAVLLALAR